jgi:hypothetical protein
VTGSPIGFYKSNWDVAISMDRKCMGIGVIIRDESSFVFAAKSKTILAIFEPFHGGSFGILAPG